MALPTILLTNGCYGKVDNPCKGKRCPALLAFDAVVSITCLILGILGALSVVGMPPAAAYSLIGVSCTITFSYIAVVVKQRCCATQTHSKGKPITKKKTLHNIYD